MKKLLGILVFVVMVMQASNLRAQTDRKFNLGLQAGLGVSGMISDENYDADFSANPGLRFAYISSNDGGLMVILDLGYWLVNYDTADYYSEYETEYFNINLMAGISSGLFYAAGGIYIAAITGATLWTDTNTFDLTDSQNSDVGLNVEFGIKPQWENLTFFLGGIVKVGFANISDGGVERRNWAFLLSVGITYAFM
ncbi:hypothetical protein ACFL20_06860 [Spirochaetota bacterium]